MRQQETRQETASASFLVIVLGLPEKLLAPLHGTIF
jgi:hypothetical protein